MLPLLVDLVAQGVLTIERLVALVCENPARLFGLGSRKGSLRPGADGDVTLVDPGAATLVDAAQRVGSADWTSYQGMRLRGRVVRRILWGLTVVKDGRPVGHRCVGGFVRWSGWPMGAQMIAG